LSDSIILLLNLHVMSATGGRWITKWHYDHNHPDAAFYSYVLKNTVQN